MKKSHEKSVIKNLFKASEVNEVAQSNTILQIEVIQATERYDRLYITEYVKNSDYSRTTLEGQLEEKEEFIIEQDEEIEMLQAKNEAMEEVLAEANDARQGLGNSMKDLRDENSRIYNALMECKRVFNGLPPEIEEILEARNDFFIKEPGNNE